MALTDKLKAIADAIRGKTGKTDGLTLDQMPTEIEGIHSGGGGEEVFWGGVNPTIPTRATCMYTRNVVYPHETVELIAFSQCEEMETFEAPYYTGYTQHSHFFNCAKLKSIKMPRISALGSAYFIRQQTVASVIEEIQLGSIGYPFTTLANNWNYGNNHTGCTITFYVDATTIAEAQAAITNWTQYGGQNTSNCTLVFRNSTTGEVITE